MPAGGEEKARAFYGGLLGLQELEKPRGLRAKGGVWFALADGRSLHLGVEENFQPAKKAHPAFLVKGLDQLAAVIERANFAVIWDQSIPDVQRFHSYDCFGNRLEFQEPGISRLTLSKVNPTSGSRRAPG